MKKEAVLITSSDWKARDWQEKMSERGVVGSTRAIECHALEPSAHCAYMVGLEKPQMFLTQLQNTPDLNGKRVAVIDINGLIPRGKRQKPVLVTTGRGVVGGVDKSLNTIWTMQNNMRGRGVKRGGSVVFENICGTALIENGKLRDQQPFVESARLTLSKPLLGFLSNIENIRKILNWSEEKGTRPAITERSSGGIDFTVLDEVLPEIYRMMGIGGLWMMLESQEGKKWMADESGMDVGMKYMLNSLLRGITDFNADRVAAIC